VAGKRAPSTRSARTRKAPPTSGGS
jgi:hypothetical protein